jgi:hypothetical protein
VKVIVNTSSKPPARRRLATVLDIQDTGASPFGSTYYKRLLACPREFALYSVVGFTPEVIGDALSTGWLYHHCLEKYYKAIQAHQRACNAKHDSTDYLWGGTKQGMADAYEALVPFEGEAGYEEVVADVRRMLDQYFEVYFERDKWRILAVEETISYQGEFDYSTRLDVLIEDLERGGMWIVEHKISKMITAELLDNYQLDLQILGQVWLVKKCVDLRRYPQFKGVIINIATKHKLPQLVRVPVSPSDQHLKAFYDSQRQWSALRGIMAKMGWPRSLGHCAGYARGYSRCTYFDLCHGQPQTTVAQWMKGEPPYGFLREPRA